MRGGQADVHGLVPTPASGVVHQQTQANHDKEQEPLRGELSQPAATAAALLCNLVCSHESAYPNRHLGASAYRSLGRCEWVSILERQAQGCRMARGCRMDGRDSPPKSFVECCA